MIIKDSHKKLFVAVGFISLVVVIYAYSFGLNQNNDTKKVSTSNEKIETLPVVNLTFPNNNLDTSNWQTYRNEEFGFEVRYPVGWIVRSSNEVNIGSSDRDIARLLFFPKKELSRDRGTGISIFDRPLAKRAKEVTERGWLVKKRIKINNAEGLAFARKDKSGNWLPPEEYEIGNANFTFDFTDGGDSRYTEEFQKILLSFRFIK